MKKSVIYASLLAVAATAALVFTVEETSAQQGEVPEARRMMYRKLGHANGVLEGLTVNDFEKIQEEAQELSLISLEAHWRTDLPPSYAQYNADFQWAVGGLIQAAEMKNLEGATLKYAQVVMSCVECHTAVRGRAQVADLP
jgi:hypothetical protein